MLSLVEGNLYDYYYFGIYVVIFIYIYIRALVKRQS